MSDELSVDFMNTAQLKEAVVRLRAELTAARKDQARMANDYIKLAETRDKLHAALEPFAKLRVTRFMTDGLKYEFRIDAADLRRANAVLRETEGGGHE